MSNQTTYDIEALTGAAKFFEEMATGADPAPLAFSQAIRRALAELELTAEVDAALADDSPVTDEEAASINASWDRFKAMFPVAKVVNDNQPDNQAVVVVLRDPPTLPVGTLLYATFKGAADAHEGSGS